MQEPTTNKLHRTITLGRILRGYGSSRGFNVTARALDRQALRASGHELPAPAVEKARAPEEEVGAAIDGFERTLGTADFTEQAVGGAVRTVFEAIRKVDEGGRGKTLVDAVGKMAGITNMLMEDDVLSEHPLRHAASKGVVAELVEMAREADGETRRLIKERLAQCPSMKWAVTDFIRTHNSPAEPDKMMMVVVASSLIDLDEAGLRRLLSGEAREGNGTFERSGVIDVGNSGNTPPYGTPIDAGEPRLTTRDEGAGPGSTGFDALVDALEDAFVDASVRIPNLVDGPPDMVFPPGGACVTESVRDTAKDPVEAHEEPAGLPDEVADSRVTGRDPVRDTAEDPVEAHGDTAGGPAHGVVEDSVEEILIGEVFDVEDPPDPTQLALDKELFAAIDAMDHERAEDALGKGANPNAEDKGLWTPMIRAVIMDNQTMADKSTVGRSMVKLLKDWRADINKPGADVGWTPLMFAASAGNTLMVFFLSSLDADPAIKGKHGETAVTLATGRPEILRMLGTPLEIERLLDSKRR